MGNRDLYYDHMSTEGSLAFNYDECHAYSMRGGVACLRLSPFWNSAAGRRRKQSTPYDCPWKGTKQLGAVRKNQSSGARVKRIKKESEPASQTEPLTTA